MRCLTCAYLRYRKQAAGGLLIILGPLHPLLHQFEGGTLDLIMAYLAVEAAS